MSQPRAPPLDQSPAPPLSFTVRYGCFILYSLTAKVKSNAYDQFKQSDKDHNSEAYLVFVYRLNYSLHLKYINMEKGQGSTGDSRLDQAVTQWLQYDKVKANTRCRQALNMRNL